MMPDIYTVEDWMTFLDDKKGTVKFTMAGRSDEQQHGIEVMMKIMRNLLAGDVLQEKDHHILGYLEELGCTLYCVSSRLSAREVAEYFRRYPTGPKAQYVKQREQDFKTADCLPLHLNAQELAKHLQCSSVTHKKTVS